MYSLLFRSLSRKKNFRLAVSLLLITVMVGSALLAYSSSTSSSVGHSAKTISAATIGIVTRCADLTHQSLPRPPFATMAEGWLIFEQPDGTLIQVKLDGANAHSFSRNVPEPDTSDLALWREPDHPWIFYGQQPLWPGNFAMWAPKHCSNLIAFIGFDQQEMELPSIGLANNPKDFVNLTKGGHSPYQMAFSSDGGRIIVQDQDGNLLLFWLSMKDGFLYIDSPFSLPFQAYGMLKAWIN